MDTNPLPTDDAIAASAAKPFLFIGPLLFTLSLGLQVMLALFFIAGPISKIDPRQQPTLRARPYIHPEHDVPIYICMVPVILAAMALACRGWRGWVNRVGTRRGDTARFQFLRYGTLLQIFLASAGLLVFLLILAGRYAIDASVNPFARTTHSLGGGAVLFLPALAAILCLALDLWRAALPSPLPPVLRGERESAGRISDRLLAAATILLIIVAIYIPSSAWPNLIGQVKMRQWVHHWNFFALGPALGYMHGQGIGAGTYSQYGVGWPLLAAKLSRFFPLSYANLLGMAVVYGCIYYIGVFIFLRRWTGRSLWGAIGVMLAILWQLFNGVGPGTIQWSAPSSTLLRHPADVWFFISLLAVARSKDSRTQFRAIAFSGFFAGLGLLFEIDTGVLLLGTFIAAGLMWWRIDVAGRRGSWRGSLVFIAGFAVGWLPGMTMASRGHLFSGAFWSGWIEGLQNQGFTGFGMLPIAGVDDAGLVLFVAVMAVYLLTIAWSFTGEPGRDRVIPASVSLYGIGLLLNFVGRSHPYNIFHAAVPFAMVVTFWLWQARGWVRYTSMPAVVASSLLVLLITVPEMRQYPSLAKSILGVSAPKPGLALVDSPRDLAGLPEPSRPVVEDFKAITIKMKSLVGEGKSILVLDSMDTSLYYAAGIRPWSRYSSLLHMTQSIPALKRVMREIQDRRPDCIVIRGPQAQRTGEFDEPEFQDLLDAFYPMVRKNYALNENVGSYELWQLRPVLR